MKFSNIAKLCDDLGINVLTKIGRLDNYSNKIRKSFSRKIFELYSYSPFKNQYI